MGKEMLPTQRKHIITVKETRTQLGKEYADATDQEIEVIIVGLELMAEIAIKEIKKSLNMVPNSSEPGCQPPEI